MRSRNEASPAIGQDREAQSVQGPWQKPSALTVAPFGIPVNAHGAAMNRPDPAASYRNLTARQKARNEARFNREARRVMVETDAQKTDAARRSSLAKAQRSLIAARTILERGGLKGQPLTAEDRKTIEEIARDSERMVARLIPLLFGAKALGESSELER